MHSVQALLHVSSSHAGISDCQCTTSGFLAAYRPSSKSTLDESVLKYSSTIPIRQPLMMPTPPRSGLSSRTSFENSTKFSRRDNGLISPAKSTFSFADETDSIPMPLAVSNKPDLLDETQISGPYGRGSPGDAALIAMVNKDRTSTDLSRRKSQFYSGVFAYREPNLTARDRVHRYSVITAEVKTNVIVSKCPSHCSHCQATI